MTAGMSPNTAAQEPTAARLPDELLERSSFLMVRIAAGFKSRALAELDAAGFSPHQYSVLALLGEQARSAQATIADALGLDRSQLVGILDDLKEKGLLVRQQNPADRRRHLISLTTTGRKHLVRLRTAAGEVEDELLAPLDAESRKILHAILLRLTGYDDPRRTQCAHRD